ncbi:guided entry of tail-anchored proteins factor CAMLG-like isoform X2 [Venturia canescens]|uniref:guided entry of tail-anchored proteins factor CAMLG-like isoform X2 n=1 Tax=Venturia canescens TaxID=32260 RepID=UPI001C9CCA97|nr:guided entry of tail-anchored proteins factor CAMLG-like isoform X2 [Venturia canescens]
MADAAAKREARRRRILENSEYRLQKITGHANHKEFPEEVNRKVIETESTSSNSSSNGILSSEQMLQNQSFDSLIDDFNTSLDNDEPIKFDQMYSATQELLNHVLSGQNIHHRRSTEVTYSPNNYANAESFNFNNSNNIRFSQEKNESHPLLNHVERDIPATSNSTLEKPSFLISALSSRLVYVILAVVVNIMIVLKLEHLFGASVMVPFLAVVIGRLCTSKTDEATQGNNMLVAALILSNCRPDFVKVIQRLKGILSIIGKVFRDLAIYIFTFVILYTVISPYRSSPDDILPIEKNAETIFENDMTM